MNEKVYVAFLKGINKGKHNRIKMDQLKHMFQSLGLKDVTTYRLNGNVIFKSSKDDETLRKMIEREFMIIYQYVVPVVLRTMEELKYLVVNCPFTKDEIKSAEKTSGEGLYYAFLKQPPSTEKLKKISQFINNGDQFKVVGKDMYLLFPNQIIRNSYLVANIYQLDIHATIRKSYTIKRLIKLYKKTLCLA